MTTYRDAGVDIDKAEEFTRMIKKRVEQAWPGKGRHIGPFAAKARIPNGTKKFSPSADGTGTKIIIASLLGMFDGTGQDAVAMGAGDVFTEAKPAYLLDVLDVARLKPELHIKIIESIIRGCLAAGCKLIGGETAELPDVFAYPWMVNLNVFVAGFSDNEHPPPSIRSGYQVYGWPSHGIASNGFSLVRKVFGLTFGRGFSQPFRELFGLGGSVYRAQKRLERYWPELGTTLGETLLTPTPIWISQIEALKEDGIRFMAHAHITGGGMPGNIPRILPPGCKVVIDRKSWVRPPIFRLIQELGKVSEEEMGRTLNQGVIMVSIVPPNTASLPEPALLIGEVRKRKKEEAQVELIGKYNDG